MRQSTKNAGRYGRFGLSAALILLALVLGTVMAASADTAGAQPAPSTLGPPEASSPGEVPGGKADPSDEEELGAFLDGMFAQQLEGYQIPGAAVAVVKDGEVLFARGYGRANVEDDEPVVADETLFRIASTSKLLTATAVMQLVEEGRLDLDEDVNTYLTDVEVPNTYPGRPVTLRHLLTHTAGFEESFTGSGARDASEVEPLGRYLAGKEPERVRPPGEAMAYSNYGVSLAGLVVEEVSGTRFDRYVKENVTDPLGMDSTTFAQPPEVGERVATGYDVEGGEPLARPFEFIDEAPAGSVSTTATDMAAFMIAHLQDGRLGDARMLEEATAREMHRRQFADHPRLDGMALGFYEQTVNGERTIQHGGNLVQAHANLVLLPEHDVGLFVAYNSYGDGGDFAEYELTDAFLDRFYPGEAPPAREPSAAADNAGRVAGSYLSTRSNQSGFEKLFTLLTGARVADNGDGSITTTGVPTLEDHTGAEQRWVEVEPLLFQAQGSDEQLAFREDGAGNITYLSGEASPPNVAYERVSTYEASQVHLGLLAGTSAVFLLTAVAWPVGAVTSWRYGRRLRKLYGEPDGVMPGRDAKAARLARPLAWAVCALALLLVAGMALVFSDPEGNLFYGDSLLLTTALVLPFPIAALAAGVLVYAALAWMRGFWGVFGRLHYSLVAVSALAFVALLAYYNLLWF